MNFSALEARIKRTNIKAITGSLYRDQKSEIVMSLNDNYKDALLGIENNENGFYTILGREKTYFYSYSGKSGEILNTELIDVLSKNGMRLGKSGDFEFIEINSTLLWMHNGETMCALWNLLIFITSLDN